MSKLRATILLFVATFIWGTAFVAQDIGSELVSAFMFNAVRSLIGFIVLIIVVLYRNKWSVNNLIDKKTLIMSVICGVLLFISVNLQQYGMQIYPEGVGASSRTAFITSTYVVIVTIVGTIKSKKINLLIILSVILTMIGLFFVCVYGNTSGLYLGDILVFGCAAGFAIHIMYINKHPEIDGIKISCFQLLVVGILSLIVSLLFETNSIDSMIKCIGPFLYSGVLSSGFAYTIEVIALQVLNASVASVIMSSESMFALVSSAIILSEKLKPYEYLGCFIVLIALILAQVPELAKSLKLNK